MYCFVGYFCLNDASELSGGDLLKLHCGGKLPLRLNVSWYFNLSPSGMLINQSIVQLVLKNKNLKIKVKPHRTDFTPNHSSLAQNLI